VPIQLAQCRFPGLAISNAKILIYFSNKYTEEILSKSTWNLLRSENTNADLQFRKKIIVIYYNFWHTFIPYRCDKNLLKQIINKYQTAAEHIACWAYLAGRAKNKL